ncbi:MAG: Mth938-like domain-containing protein [Rhodospirillales bacterium]
MDVTPRVAEGRQLIESYGNGGFTVSGLRHQGSILVLPDRTLAWPVADFEAATPESLGLLRDLEEPVEVLLLGCGPQQLFLPPARRQAFKDVLGLVVECMASGPACRTYNILATEDRRVAAAVMAVD